MFLAKVLRGGGERGGLPLLLLVSSLMHLSLLGFSYPGKAGGSQDEARSQALRASLRPGVDAASVAPAPRDPDRSPVPERISVPVPEPALEPAPDVSVSSVSSVFSANDALASNPAPGLRPGMAFYDSQALTIRPVALSEPLLDAGDDVLGEIVLALWIDDLGAVVEVSVERSELPADRLPAVADAFRMVRFSPAELNGQKVGALMRIAVRYDERLPIEP